MWCMIQKAMYMSNKICYVIGASKNCFLTCMSIVCWNPQEIRTGRAASLKFDYYHGTN